MNRIFAVALLSGAIVANAAWAQTTTDKPAEPATPAATNADTMNRSDKVTFKDNWRASKLIGLKVYNEANERLGDINELLVDKNGKINAAVIGIGGFLGMGEHDIAVSMDKLKFVEEPVRTSSAPATEARTTTGSSPSTTNTAPAGTANDWTPDHAMMSGTKDQLKALPQFKYSD